MNLKLFKTVFFITFFLITSCKSYRYVDIQILKPAETDTLINFNKLYIVNSEGLKIDTSDNVDPSYYTQFIINFKEELKKKLIETPLFSNAEIIVTNYQSLGYSFGDLDLDQRKNTMICTIQSVLLSDSVENILGYESWWMKYRVIYHLNIQFSRITTPYELINKVIVDTTYWNSPEISYDIRDPLIFPSKDKKYAPSKDMAYINIGKYAAERVVQKISPCWITEERMLFYNKNKTMVKAYKTYCDNQLDKAISEWKVAYNSSNIKIAARAAHNIAVSYEIMDSIGLANKWIYLSVQKEKHEKSISYKKILTKRFNDMHLLDKQLLDNEN